MGVTISATIDELNKRVDDLQKVVKRVKDLKSIPSSQELKTFVENKVEGAILNEGLKKMVRDLESVKENMDALKNLDTSYIQSYTASLEAASTSAMVWGAADWEGQISEEEENINMKKD